MQNIKPLSASELLIRTKDLVAQERRVTLKLIEYLREIDRRMLFAELGYGSLFEFCVKELGLSEGSAQRRIQALRLIRDVPAAKEAIESGRVSLSNAAKVQSFFMMEKKLGKKPDKVSVLAQIEGKSQRECEHLLFELSPQSVPRERERVVSPQEREIKIVVSEELYQKLQKLRAVLAHALPEASYAQLIEHSVDAALERINKKRGKTSEATGGKREDTSQAIEPVAPAVQTEIVSSTPQPLANRTQVASSIHPLPAGIRIHLPALLKRAVWAQARHQCEYESPQGRRCTSTYRLEIDHKIPLAQGGPNAATNLRVLCWSHHRQKTGAEKFGARFPNDSPL